MTALSNQELFDEVIMNHHFDRYLKGTFGIDTMCIRIAAAIISGAFVDVPTLNSIPSKALMAGAHI